MPAPLLIPFLAAAGGLFARIMATRVGMWVVTALGFLGLSFATHTVVMEPMLDHVASTMSVISGDIAAWMGVLNLDRYVSIVLSAYIAGNVKRAFLARRGA